MKTPAILLIVVGIVIIVWGAFGFKTRDKVLDVGPIHATAEHHDRLSIPPVFGGLALAGGIVLLAVGAKKNS